MVRGLERCGRPLVVHFDQEKPELGDTCSRLAYTKQAVASLNTNMYNRQSTLFGPDGSSPARRKPARARFWKFGNLEIQIFWVHKNIKHESSQNPNPCHPKCRHGLDWPEKEPPGPIWGHPRLFSPWTDKNQKITTKMPKTLGKIIIRITCYQVIATQTALSLIHISEPTRPY